MAIQTLLTVCDETTFDLGKPEYVVTLQFPNQRITVRELIRARVYQEVQDYNARLPEYFHSLVQPSGAELTLNGFRLADRREIDWEKQYQHAIQAFESNGFIILLDDRQVEGLDQWIEIRPETSVTFLKLVPLVGG